MYINAYENGDISILSSAKGNHAASLSFPLSYHLVLQKRIKENRTVPPILLVPLIREDDNGVERGKKQKVKIIIYT